jgi:hypothetical protein
MDADAAIARHQPHATRAVACHLISRIDLEQPRQRRSTKGNSTMYEMMNGNMGWGMGITGILVLILLVLGIAAALKYLLRR